jgi:hypothetical protein
LYVLHKSSRNQCPNWESNTSAKTNAPGGHLANRKNTYIITTSVWSEEIKSTKRWTKRQGLSPKPPHPGNLLSVLITDLDDPRS